VAMCNSIAIISLDSKEIPMHFEREPPLPQLTLHSLGQLFGVAFHNMTHFI
jgi:hypothetical protein